MERSIEVLMGMAAAALAALAAFAVYRWRQRKRVRQAETWVNAYLSTRYGELAAGPSINCSDDPLWPVLVTFTDPRTGVRQRLQFDYRGAGSPLALLSEKEDQPGLA